MKEILSESDISNILNTKLYRLSESLRYYQNLIFLIY